SGKAADIEKAFNVTLRRYQHPTEAREFFAADTDPSVSSALPIQDISGLDNFRRPHPHYKVKSAGTNSANPSPAVTQQNANPNLGSGPGGNYVGDDFRKAYAAGTSLNGAGQSIALVQFDGYFLSDIVSYENLVGRTNIPLQNILIDGFGGNPTGTGGELEVSLDIEMVISMAPALAKILVYEGNPFNFHPNNVLNRIATDNLARQVSCSWGWTGGPNGTTAQIFQQMAVQGQSFFNASGDSDAFPVNGPGSVDDPGNFGEPASSPFITQVGGTTLTMNGSGVAYTSETVWNWGIRFGSDGIGSSGGVSSSYPIPTWQTNINMPARGGSASLRNIPDVSMTADDVLVIADGGVQYFGVGGTSCAAPLWAGFMALVNQQAANNGLAAVGFVNPALYNIAKGANYTNCFHDVTTGNNTWSGSPTQYFATNNYDLCTGLGTPRGTNLINALAATINPVTHISPPLPPYGTNLAALYGVDPNGTWSLFVQDDTPIDSGIISNGWSLNLTIAQNLVGSASDVALTMSTSNSIVTYGAPIVFVLTATNYGPSAATGVIVADDLPAGTTLVSAIPTAGTTNRSGSTLTWNIGSLATNAGARLTLTLQPNSVGTFLNYAIASSITDDPNPDDDAASIAINVGVAQPPQLASVLVNSNGMFSVTVSDPNVPPSTTVIQTSTNLTTWLNVYTNTPPFTFTDPNSTNYPIRFYRALRP
ncbi:MAG: hypothetical protein QOD03_383, partial [Verrucomicrobiota bacterium]